MLSVPVTPTISYLLFHIVYKQSLLQTILQQSDLGLALNYFNLSFGRANACFDRSFFEKVALKITCRAFFKVFLKLSFKTFLFLKKVCNPIQSNVPRCSGTVPEHCPLYPVRGKRTLEEHLSPFPGESPGSHYGANQACASKIAGSSPAALCWEVRPRKQDKVNMVDFATDPAHSWVPSTPFPAHHSPVTPYPHPHSTFPHHLAWDSPDAVHRGACTDDLRAAQPLRHNVLCCHNMLYSNSVVWPWVADNISAT